ncbi:unnamed protein product [Meloidogyne enterolobii]|uniref:Uncharacterized protein n=1 Tax=Meloidogyne enterolobii TaxID=390850 RepID=A0ACB1B4I5_MELEN
MLSVQTAFLHFEKIDSEIVEEKKKRKSQALSVSPLKIDWLKRLIRPRGGRLFEGEVIPFLGINLFRGEGSIVLRTRLAFFQFLKNESNFFSTSAAATTTKLQQQQQQQNFSSSNNNKTSAATTTKLQQQQQQQKPHIWAQAPC